MAGLFFLAGLILGAGGGFWLTFRRFMGKYSEINAIIHNNRHRHPALILERVENHIRQITHKRF